MAESRFCLVRLLDESRLIEEAHEALERYLTAVSARSKGEKATRPRAEGRCAAIAAGAKGKGKPAKVKGHAEGEVALLKDGVSAWRA